MMITAIKIEGFNNPGWYCSGCGFSDEIVRVVDYHIKERHSQENEREFMKRYNNAPLTMPIIDEINPLLSEAPYLRHDSEGYWHCDICDKTYRECQDAVDCCRKNKEKNMHPDFDYCVTITRQVGEEKLDWTGIYHAQDEKQVITAAIKDYSFVAPIFNINVLLLGQVNYVGIKVDNNEVSSKI